MEEYDIVIVGGGPAGLAASIYAVRAGMKTLLFEKKIIGGQISVTGSIENYPGFSSITGPDLADKMKEQAKEQGVEIRFGEVKKISDDGKQKIVLTSKGEIKCYAVIIAVGSFPRKLGIPGEEEFENKGVHYCALCDGPLYKGKDVAMIGGGDSAIKESIPLSNVVNKIYVIHRRDTLRAEQSWQKRAFAKKNI